MSGDSWLFPALIVLGAVLLTVLRRGTGRRQDKESWLPVPAARAAPSTTSLFIAAICTLGIIWLVPWSAHLSEATWPDLLIGIVFIGVLSLCVCTE